jgi:hypothetical protein
VLTLHSHACIVLGMTYEFRITLLSIAYDLDEREIETVHGVRKHVGTEDSAITAARRTRTPATSARIERVAVSGGPRFQAHETVSFTIELAE